MKPFEEMVYIREIVLQIKIAKWAANLLQDATVNFKRLEIWGSIQLTLIATGNVSKILWPSQKSSEARGEMLRTLLGVDNKNLLSDRKLRNHFEHYDHRIEEWAKESPSAVYRDLIMNPHESMWGGNPDDKFLGKKSCNRNRAYNSSTKTVTFRGESVDLGALLSALDDILNKCRPFVLT